MKNNYIIGVLVIGLIVSIVSLVLLLSMKKGALLVFSKNHYDYGEVDYNHTVTFKVDFVNGGNKPLSIDKVIPSCQCFVTELEKRSYEPGEKGQIKVEFHATEDPGRLIHHTLAFKTNDYREAVHVVELTAKMKPSVTVFPRELFLGSIRPGETRIAEVIISPCGSPEEFEITSATTTVSGAQISFSRLKDFPDIATSRDYSAFPPDTSYIVLIQLPKNNTLGMISGNIEIRTTSKLSPMINVSVQGEITSSFTMNPTMLFFSLTCENKTPTRALTISNEFPFKLEIPSDHAHLHIISETEYPSKECKTPLYRET